MYDEWLRACGRSFEELAASERWWLDAVDQRERHEVIDPRTGECYGFATPSGKIELRSSVLARLGYDPLPAYEADDDDAERGDLPLYLLTGATRIDATHQDHRHVDSLRARHPDPIVEIDPALARMHGVGDGDWVRIETGRGFVRQRARLVPGLGTDRVNAERWWYPEREGTYPSLFGFGEANVNALTSCDLDGCDPAYGALPYRVARCRIARAQDLPAPPAAELPRDCRAAFERSCGGKGGARSQALPVDQPGGDPR